MDASLSVVVCTLVHVLNFHMPCPQGEAGSIHSMRTGSGPGVSMCVCVPQDSELPVIVGFGRMASVFKSKQQPKRIQIYLSDLTTRRYVLYCVHACIHNGGVEVATLFVSLFAFPLVYTWNRVFVGHSDMRCSCSLCLHPCLHIQRMCVCLRVHLCVCLCVQLHCQGC